ncbi:DUF3299 domain-containing protein [Roseivivax sp.]
MTPARLSRRRLLALSAACLVPGPAQAAKYRALAWDDLMPPGLPYGEIVGPGFIDEANDIWNPQYDANGLQVRRDLDGVRIRLPGYIIPFETARGGVTAFMLVPYVGACIHTPPPPPNQLVFVRTDRPWPNESMWDPVFVFGRLSAKPMATQIADAGYQMSAERIESYR